MALRKGKKKVEKDQIIIKEGSEATNNLFYLLSGTAIAEVGGKAIGTINAGEWFGEMAAILGAQRTASVRAVTPCEVMIFNGINDKAIIDAMSSDPKLVHKLIETLAMRLVESSRRGVSTTVRTEGTIERYRKAVSGTAYVLEKVCEKYKTVKIMKDVKDHLLASAGIQSGKREDVNMDFFATSRNVLEG